METFAKMTYCSFWAEATMARAEIRGWVGIVSSFVRCLWALFVGLTGAVTAGARHSP